MNVRKLCPLAAAVGVWVGGAADAMDPAKPAAAKPAVKPAATADGNQKLAEAVTERLLTTGVADGADVRIVTEGGTVTLFGPCQDAKKKADILDAVRTVPGVTLVRDGLTAAAPAVTQAQAQIQAPGLPAVGPIASMPYAAVPPSAMGPVVDPAPVGMPGVGPGEGYAPPLPPNAWPTYAPYNNVARVGYPEAYPYNAFPFIGPFYPFPKVPLGWRSVKLEWEDGHWWYNRTSTAHDYWRVRFW